MILGPGDLRLSLDVDDKSKVKFLRPAQSDMTWAFEDKLSRGTVQTLSGIIRQTTLRSTTRTYTFYSQTGESQVG